MKKKGIIFTLSLSLALLCGSALSAYVIYNNNIQDNIEVGGTNDDSYHMVSFLDTNGNQIENGKIYLKDGDYLNYEDIPSSYRSAIYEWQDNSSGQTIFSLDNSSFSKGFEVKEDLTLKAIDVVSNVGTTTPSGGNFNDTSGVTNGSTVTTGEGSVSINQGTNTGSEITMSEPILKNVDFDINFKTTTSSGGEGDQNIYQDLGSNGTTQHSSDKTIGLEDPNSEASIYKPKAGSTANLNPLVTRLVLQKDTLVIGQSWLGVGARTGFYGASGWSQFNYQGLINGYYNEIDLNGHTLVIGSGATLELRGSIIDSSAEQTGQLIVENGGIVKSTFVIEDHYHETSIPIAYAYGDAPFKMYRMPYLNVKMRLNKGASLIGYLRLDFGGDGNDNYADTELGIVGNGSTYMIDTTLCSNESYIIRKPDWDDYWYPQDASQKDLVNTETETIQSIVYQEFDYEFYNCDNVVINSPTLTEIPYSAAATTFYFQIYWDRCDIFIPPYFEFYLYNSNVKITNNIIFMPGSYLYVDETSSITLSCNTFTSGKKLYRVTGDFLGIMESMLPDLIKFSSSYQGVGGIIFMHEKSYWGDSYKGWADGNNNDSQPALVFNSTSRFWSYLNKNYPAKADVYGEIKFDTSTTLVKEKYHLGGDINIHNLSKFVNNYNLASDRVELYNSIFIGTTCHFEIGTGGGDSFFNIDSYSALPLISNGNVLTDMTTLGLRSDYLNNIYTFDFDTGLIQVMNSSLPSYYAFTFTKNTNDYNNSNNYVNKSRYDGYNNTSYQNAIDDLSIKFYEATPNGDGTVTINGINAGGNLFIYFRGAFFRFINGNVDIFKFKGPSPDGGNIEFSGSIVKVLYSDVSIGTTDNPLYYYGHKTWVVNI